MPLDPYGKIKSDYINELKKDFRFQLTNQPVSLLLVMKKFSWCLKHSIVVLVYNLGAVIGAQTGNLEHTNTVTQVKKFLSLIFNLLYNIDHYFKNIL